MRFESARWAGWLGLVSLLLAGGTLSAATFTWVRHSGGNASGSWTNQANWSGGGLPTTANDAANFATLDLTADSTITLDGSQAIGSLTFGDATNATAASWLVNAGTPSTALLTLSGASPAISVSGLASGKATVINAVVAGTNGVTKSGTSYLQFNAANTYSGGTVLNGSDCRISVGNDYALGSGKVLVGANPGDGQVWFQPAGTRTLTNDFEVRSIRWIIDWSSADGVAAGDLTVNGNILLNAGGANVRDIYCGKNLTLNGNISVTPAANPFNKQGSSLLTLNGTNTFSGPTAINGGTLLVNGAINSSGTVTVNSGTTLGGTGFLSGPVSVQDGGILAPGNSGSGTITLGGLGATAGAVLSFGLGATNSSANAFVRVNGNLTLAGLLKITDLGGFSSGTYTSIWYSGTLSNLGLVPSTVPNGKSVFVKTNTPHYVVFQVLDGFLAPAAGQAVPMDLASPMTLSWVQGPTAVAYDLYLGTSSNSVANASTNTAGLYQGRTAALTSSAGTLAPGTTYYWRVDYVAADGTVTAGLVLSFTTGAAMYDAMADTWVAADALGRVLPGNAVCGPPRTNRYVGIFYFLWQGPNSIGGGAGGDPTKWDVSRYLAAHPWTNPLNPWADNPYFQTQSAGTAWYWGRPAVDYYAASDPWVLRRNIALLTDAGVDVLIFDYSNATTYDTALNALCSTIRQMRFEGFKTHLKLVFLTHASSPQTATYLYNNLYSQNQFPDLWFYWQGKPLILGYPSQNGVTVSQTISNFFTWRTSWANVGQLHDEWQWIDSATPQNCGYDARADIPEQLPVTCGGWASSNLGHSYTNHAEPAYNSYNLPVADTQGQGLLYQEQMFYGLKYDPQFLFITGWNEWIAGVWFASSYGNPSMLGQPCPAGGFYFVDEYNEEFSRDIEPMRGGHTDNYYFQMVGQNRQYKGARPLPSVSPPQTIDLGGDFSQWTSVAPVYYDPANDTLPRSFASAISGQPAVTNYTGRNDFTVLKVARDASSICFYAACSSNLTSCAGSNWMVLFIDADQNRGTGWEGYDYAVNLGGVSAANTTTLYHNTTTTSGWAWTPVRGDVPYRVSGNQLMLRLSRVDLGLGSDPIAFDFHWADNFQTNDIADFGVNGDSAPDRRFNYRYQVAPQQAVALLADDFESGAQPWWGESWTNGSRWSLTSATSYSANDCAVCNLGNGTGQSALIARADTSSLASLRVSFRYKLHNVTNAQNAFVQYYCRTGWTNIRNLGRDQYYASGQNWGYDEHQDVWLQFVDARLNAGADGEFFHTNFAFRIDGGGLTGASESIWVDDFAVTGTALQTTLPPPWLTADVGTNGLPGSAGFSGAQFVVSGSGDDIWNAADTFRFVYQGRTGDGSITARVTSQDPTDAWAKAGVMMRESLDGGSRHIMMLLTPANGLSFQCRVNTGTASDTTTDGGSFPPPYWVRLTRSGNSFTGFASADGLNWTQIGATNISGFGTNALWGLAATAHNNARVSTATFDEVALSSAPVFPPIPSQTVTAGQTLAVTNAASDPDAPPQTLTFSALSAPTNASVDPLTGDFIWRPTLAQSPLVTNIKLKVQEGTPPGLSATQTFWVTVSQPVQPRLAAAAWTNAAFGLGISGDAGPDYTIQGTTNLDQSNAWITLLTTNSPAMPFWWADPQTNLSQRYYRVLLGP